MYQVGFFLIRNAGSFPERKALVYGDRVFTYAELNRQVNRLSNALAELGVKKGARLAFLFNNDPDLVMIWFAAQKLGVTAVPLNPRLRCEDIRRILDLSECEALIYHESLREVLLQAKESCHVLRLLICQGSNIPEGEHSLAALLAHNDDSEAQVSLKGEDESVLLFTSGTTGVPKGVIRSQQVIRDYALMMAIENENCQKPEVLLTHCPLFHTAGLSLIMKITAVGGTFVLLNRVVPQEIFKQIEKYGVTQIMMLPPVMYQRLAENQCWRDYNLSSVVEAQCTAGKCSLELANIMQTLFPGSRIKLSYGSTETCAPTSTLLSMGQVSDNPERIKTVGKLNSLVEMRLVDDNGKDVPDGVPGEAIVRSSMVFSGYLKDPGLTGQTLRDGWVYTGDMLLRDQDGYYYLVDRKKDMVKTGGYNVYAQEVEGVLCDHPAIAECAVIGVPDKTFDEAVAVVIVLNKGTTLPHSELTAYCRSRMASFKKPRYVAFVEALPRNNLGKIQKNVLREQADALFQNIFNDNSESGLL
ncbi:MAG: acyl--CoA ligase [Desulfovibrio sp.]|jgi:long-chain acyl-CoA synthetase|nr:acyl--CoA ligase [Desulfovibrio sp.]